MNATPDTQPLPSRGMGRGFYLIMAAQFFSALADNALLVAAIRLMRDNAFPEHLEPLLKLFFSVSYVLLAAHAGAFADALHKRNVMFISNAVKLGGCVLLLLSPDAQMLQFMPLLVIIMLGYALVGLSAAIYSPAKYGIVTELLPHQKLVLANSWIEGLTVGGIILGTLVGGVLINDKVAYALLDLPIFDNSSIDTSPESAMIVIATIYLIAALINIFIPKTVKHLHPFPHHPLELLRQFTHCIQTLWRDPMGQITLAVTTLFWGTGAALQFLILRWGNQKLGLSLEHAAYLQALTGIGIFIGVAFAVKVKLEKAASVLPLGMIIGLLVLPMTIVDNLTFAVIQTILVGTCSGLFIVPMNAMLQHRGHQLMGAGKSIAVQNFNENISIVLATGMLFLLEMLGVPFVWIVVLFCGGVIGLMVLVMFWYRYNLKTQSEKMAEIYRIAEQSHH